MALSRKHYQDLAVIAGGSVADTPDQTAQEFTTALASWLAANNPRFDRRRFLAAVNVAYRTANGYDEPIRLVKEES